MPPAEPLDPFFKFRLSDEIRRRIRIRAAFLNMSMRDYIVDLVEKDTDDFFQRIDSYEDETVNGGY
jgi:hypothetical protein